jgi:hypothetical protein
MTDEKEIFDALEASVKLQSHYAELLNMHDGGTRLTFRDAYRWMARLREIRGELPDLCWGGIKHEKE